MVLLSLAAAGCSLGPEAPRSAGLEPLPRLAPGRLTYHSDPAYLESRVVRQTRDLLVRPRRTEPGDEVAAKGAPATLATRLVLTATVLPPEVDGRIVQACDVDLDPITRVAVVGYNFAGPDFAGALQVIDFRDESRPVLLAEVLSHDADINAVLKRGPYVYAGLASGEPGLATPAVLDEFQLGTSGLTRSGRWVGAQGGCVVHVDRLLMRIVAVSSEEDARALAFDAAGELLCASGSGGGLSRRTLPSLAVTARTAVAGFGNAGAKGTLEVDGYCFLGAGDGGFQVRDRDGVLQDMLENRTLAGLSPELAVTNAVSVRGMLGFVAAGAVGVQVVHLGRFGRGGEALPSGLAVLGELDFGDPVSSNMVKARGNVLVVAAGLGGVLLVQMSDL